MLPKQLKYGSKVESAAAKSSRVNIAPQNGTGPYDLGNTIIFNIPTRQSLVLVSSESYLRFQVNAISSGDNTAIRWESGGAASCIQRVRLYHGSNLLEDIDNYNLLNKMLMDIQTPTDAIYGKMNVVSGTRSDLVVTPQFAITPVNVTASAANYTDGGAANTNINAAVNASLNALSSRPVQARQINSGELLANPTQRSSTPTTYCINLVSMLGSLCSQNYFPLFACTSAPLRLEITLVDSLLKCFNSVAAVTLATAGNFLSNVEYIANFIELSDSAMQTVASSLQGQPLQMVVPQYRNYQFSYALANAQTQVSFAIPAKFSSLKSLFVTIRDKASGELTYFPLSSVTAKLIDYQFRIGPSIFPPKAPSTYQECFCELIKAIGSMSDLDYQPSIDKSSYTLEASAANSLNLETNFASSVSSGSFYLGIDLENYVNANKDSIYAGYNTNTDDIFAIMNFAATGGNVVNARFDAYSLYDCAVIFENGTAYCRY